MVRGSGQAKLRAGVADLGWEMRGKESIAGFLRVDIIISYVELTWYISGYPPETCGEDRLRVLGEYRNGGEKTKWG